MRKSIDRIDKDNNLIRLIVGQICSAGIVQSVYTEDRKCYAVPFVHLVWVGGVIGSSAVPYYDTQEKAVGLAIRITNDGTIVSNPTYRGNAIIAFLSQNFEDCNIHTVMVTKVNRRSVNVEPIDYTKNPL